ncbi:MAG: type II toxin-antitoxin system HigB family toxin [Bacteroidota bacterium]|jgi:mRNA interferase HigB
MVIISKTKIIEFYQTETKARELMLQWYNITLLSDWQDFHSIKQTFNSVDSVGNDRYVFNVGGNKYRIVAMIHFSTRTVYLRSVNTHKEYDKIDCQTI